MMIFVDSWCIGERGVVLQVLYLEMSDRDKMSGTFMWFHEVFKSASWVFAIEAFPSKTKVKQWV